MSDRLLPGQKLEKGQQLVSEDKRYVLSLQHDGNLVLYVDHRPLWASDTAGIAVERAEMQKDGNLVIYGYDNKPVWASDTAGNPGSQLIMQNDGNAVIYKPVAIWASNTAQ
ncbi:lectin [Endozoicomonas sp. SM1973]|uniref:Lectin n=1 Tax=Spartinivicinus marinus TaxID=2994442 RepID=A0A853I5F9_9GAMM|nr:lectin [Spartinivicinus marinus]NYZ69130.1 lectin [Spartinivicinus marinus]